MTINITSGKSVGVVRTLGGELISYKNDGIEYVWQIDPMHWEGQAKILFPVCCSPKDGKMAHDGVEYPMVKHGFLHKREFEPILMSKSKVILEQRESEETLKMFPFCFSFKTEHTVTDNGFSTRFIIKNLDKNEMTFCVGGHPGFNCPLREEDGGFEDYSIYFDDAEGCTVSVCNKDGYMDASVPKLDRLKGTNELPLLYSDFDNDALVIENLPQKSARLISRKTGKGFRFTFNGFDVLGVWTPPKKNSPLVCFEPWNGLPADVSETTDAKSKKYAKTIAPDEEYVVEYSVELIK
ncbi:MAG: aldose 1-epimerase family protein [Ruminococcaceae bacterium]|nr:aldose 1-epimerase family protein [Oscillospiraceae bacterium]